MPIIIFKLHAQIYMVVMHLIASGLLGQEVANYTSSSVIAQ